MELVISLRSQYSEAVKVVDKSRGRSEINCAIDSNRPQVFRRPGGFKKNT